MDTSSNYCLPGNYPTQYTSYRPISVLRSLSKIMEKLILSKVKEIIEDINLISKHQFRIGHERAIIEQVHRNVNIICESCHE